MSYDQTTDLETPNRLDRQFKDDLEKAKQILETLYVGNVFCVAYKKDRLYYRVVDVALWSRCGNIKTVLFVRLRKRPFGICKTFHGKDQFIFRNKDKYAIYNVQVYSRNYGRDPKKYDPITEVSLVKIPNLKECTCA